MLEATTFIEVKDVTQGAPPTPVHQVTDKGSSQKPRGKRRAGLSLLVGGGDLPAHSMVGQHRYLTINPSSPPHTNYVSFVSLV